MTQPVTITDGWGDEVTVSQIGDRLFIAVTENKPGADPVEVAVSLQPKAARRFVKAAKRAAKAADGK